MSYKQLTLKQRYHISAFRKYGYSQKEMAQELGASPSTIISRGRVTAYMTVFTYT